MGRFLYVAFSWAVAHAYETWHLVDLAQVICPKPTSQDPAAPPYPEYNLGINYTTELQVDAPHIVGFIRASKQAVSITFKIEDYYGEEVVPETTVQLQAAVDAVPSTCDCTSPEVPPEVAATYGHDYGKQCNAWDNAKCDTLWGNVTVGEWCCRSWCFSTPDCPDAYQSQAIPGQYFSYAVCESVVASPCPWKEQAAKQDPCACRDRSVVFSQDMLTKFQPSYGASCSNWDMQNCATNYRPDQVDTWCCASWCYVDKECPTAIASLNAGMEGILFWSDNVCVDDPKVMLQCPYKPQPNVSASDTSCDCLNETMPSVYITIMGLDSTYANYGQQCAPHDADICEKVFPGADHGMWCCTSWCWVSSKCARGYPSTLWPGHYWSSSKCDLNAEAISACKYDSSCECRGQLPAGSFGSSSNFAADYGSTCSAWDSVDCKVVWGSDADSGWNNSADHEWCCDSWCYVNSTCPIAKKSWLGIGFYFSYETCDDGALTYNEAADTCDAARRLSARRRSGGSWSSSRRSSSWSSPRRRAPFAPSTSPRRRSWMAPSATTARRRAPPPPPTRRRAPPPPVPSPLESRRRITSLSGNTYVTTPRRRYMGSDTTMRRRRSIEPEPYGYANRPHMMNNYGGTMPYQTPYGYSGYNAYPPQSQANVAMYAVGGLAAGAGAMYVTTPRRRAATTGTTTARRRRTAPPQAYGYTDRPTLMNNYGGNMPSQTSYGYSGVAKPANSNTNIAMYAAGGAVAGAVVGAGAMYAYNNMYNENAYGDHRRRRVGNYYDVEWCVVTASGSRNGAFMECNQCYRLYGYSYCQSARNCNTAAGCGYTTPSSFNRDDLAATGFIPNSYAPPLKVTFTSITGDDIDTDPVSGICPPQTQAQADLVETFNKTMSFKPDLFLVLTKQETLQTASNGCSKDTTTTCTSSCWIDYSECISGVCQCKTGYCFNGRTCSATGINGAYTPAVLLPWLLLMFPLFRALR